MTDERIEKRHKSDLTSKQATYVEALARGKGLDDAAQAAGIVERTGRTWRGLPSVQAALRLARQARLADATSIATAMMGDALDTLKSVMEDTGAPASARVNAARAILESGIKFNETLDLAERVARLEVLNGKS